MLGMGIDVTSHTTPAASQGTESGPAPNPNPVISAMIMGQSELEYLFNTGTYYRQITPPKPGDGNLIVFTQSDVGTAPVRREVNATTVAAGQVNPAMAALSAFLDHVRPGQTFVVGDGAVSGTSRLSLVSDDLNASATLGHRRMSDFVAVKDQIEAEFGPVGNLIECWYNSDAAGIPNFKTMFWPYYFGLNGDGSRFELGTEIVGYSVDYCLWDGDTDTDVQGRGIFRQDETRWHMLTPMPFFNAPIDTEATNFSVYNGRLTEPARATVIGLTSDPTAQASGLRVGPSAHVTKFGPNDALHPDVTNADGQIQMVWPIGIALLRAAGVTIEEPTISGIEGPENGSYADIVVDLPNGGDLTTLRMLRGDTYSGATPHRQPVTGVEMTRGGTRRPVFPLTQTGYPEPHRGTVSIVDIGSGSPRRGRVRVTPETPFAFGDNLSYLRGQASAATLLPRDFGLYSDMLIEHIPVLHDENATYPFEGIAVRPFQEDLAVNVPAPAFVARGATFNPSNGVDYLYDGSLSVPAGTNGLISLWMRHTQPPWGTPQRHIMEVREGSNMRLTLASSGTGVMNFRLATTEGWKSGFIFADAANSQPLLHDTWYHIMIEWQGGDAIRMYVNGTLVRTVAIGTPSWNGREITKLAVGTDLSVSGPWAGDLAHLWFDPMNRLDLSINANREKFGRGGSPVDLGGNGELPLGSAPPFYFDGDAPAWNNQGTASSLPVSGALGASGIPQL